MTSLTVEDGKLVVRDGALGTEQACCCELGEQGNCEGCFVDFAGTFNWTFTADNCNGNAVNMAGTIVDGMVPNGELQVSCTEDFVCIFAGDPFVAGLLLSLFDGGCEWREILPGGIFERPCDTARTMPGTYTLKNCDTGETGTLVIA